MLLKVETERSSVQKHWCHSDLKMIPACVHILQARSLKNSLTKYDRIPFSLNIFHLQILNWPISTFKSKLCDVFWNILILIAVCYATMKFCCLQENSTEDGGLRSILYRGQKHSQMWELYEIRNLSSYHYILMLISNDGHIQRILELHGFKECDLIIARSTFWSHIIPF